MVRYYLDTCIWRDYFENRSDRFRPLGEWALMLIKKIIEENNIIFYSEFIIEELQEAYTLKEIENIFSIATNDVLIKIEVCGEQLKEAVILSKRCQIPRKDALHAILAKDNNAILVTRDKHFYELEKEISVKKPEDLL